MTWFIAYMLIGLAITILFVSSSCFRDVIKDTIQANGIEGVWNITMTVAGGIILMTVTWPINIICFITGFIEALIGDE